MGRQKKIVLAVEDIWTDTKYPENGKYLLNFITLKDNIIPSFEKASQRNLWKEKGEKNSEEEVKKVMAVFDNPKKDNYFFYDENIDINSISLSPKVKISDDYIYRVRFEDAPSSSCDSYVTFKEAVSMVSKKIKNKYACFIYDGNREIEEYSEKELERILTLMCNRTCSIYLAQMLRDNTEDSGILITVYKNFLNI